LEFRRVLFRSSLSDAAGKYRAPQGMGGSLHHGSRRREMVGKAVVDEVAAPEARGVECPCERPVVAAVAFRLVDRTGRREHACRLSPVNCRKTTEHALLDAHSLGIRSGPLRQL